MIKYEWRESLCPAESAELANLLGRAAGCDAEPDYSTIDFDDLRAAMERCDTDVRHLLIWMLPRSIALGQHDEPQRLAALLRLEFGSPVTASATVVVDPALRSIGIVTLLLEQVGIEASGSDGWMGTGARTVTAWARGNHPAAARLSNRFLIPRTRRVWKLLRPFESAESVTAATVLERIDAATLAALDWATGVTHYDRLLALRENGRVVGLVAVDLQPIETIGVGRCATIEYVTQAAHADSGALRRLLDGAAAVAHDAGCEGVIIYVDSDDAALVSACRVTGFQHDRTDVRYQLGADD